MLASSASTSFTLETGGGRITARDDAGSVVVIKLPALPCTPGSARHLEACRNNLFAHRPWEGEPTSAYRDLGGVIGLDSSASLAGEEPKLAQLWDAFVQANRHLAELRFGDMLAGRLSLARREAEHTEDNDDDDDGLLLDQPDDWMDGANMRRRGAAREEQEEDTRWNADHNWDGSRVDEVQHELERGPMWIANAKKAAAGTGPVTDIPDVTPDSLNERCLLYTSPSPRD